MGAFLERWGVRHRLSSAYHPQSNGRAEAAVKSAKRMMRDNTKPNGDLDHDKIVRAFLAHRNTPTDSTGISPAHVIFGRQLPDGFKFTADLDKYNDTRVHPAWRETWRLREAANRQRFFCQQQTTNARARPRGPLHVGARVLVQNRHDRTWDRSGRVTAVLPNNAYYVSLDGSRRVTQRTRAHIKPIAIFPLHAGDASCGRPPLATNDAPIITRPEVEPVPVAADPPFRPETPPLEPADAPTTIADDVKVQVERLVDRAPTRPSSASPVARRREHSRLPASVSQPTPRPPISSRFAPAVEDVAPKRRRGRPRKTPAPMPVAESVHRVAESVPDTAPDRAPSVRPSSASADPSWQPRIALRRVDAPVVRPEARPGKPAVNDGRREDQPEVARPSAMTRSGRISRPPLFYGLGGDVAD